jgi:hypothetical protein
MMASNIFKSKLLMESNNIPREVSQKVSKVAAIWNIHGMNGRASPRLSQSGNLTDNNFIMLHELGIVPGVGQVPNVIRVSV